MPDRTFGPSGLHGLLWRGWSNRAVLIGGGLTLGLLIGLGLRMPSGDQASEAVPLANLDAGPARVATAPSVAAPRVEAPAGEATAAESSDAEQEQATAVAMIQGPLAGDLEEIEAAATEAPALIDRSVQVKRGDTLMKLLLGAGVPRAEAHNAVTALSEVFSPRRLKPGQEIRLALFDEAAGSGEATPILAGLRLDASVDETVHVARQAETGDFFAETREVVLETRQSAHAGVIDSSLFEAASDAGMPLEAMIQLIRLFSFDVDFQREVQRGDRFEVVYDSYYDANGNFAKTGPMRYGAMVLSGKRIEFYHFVAADGTDDHFDAKGRSVRRALLKTPVDGARISSGFGMRKHPISGFNKMHRGLDFAAPRGTPIYAAGNGVVERASRNGGYGKYVRIRHNSTYKTAYAHMKSYAKGIKKGARVKQGQVIGYVGSTGNSTGPHLHYEVFIDGKQVNPRKIKLPSGKQLKGADLEAFQQARAEIDRLRQEALPALLMVEADCEDSLDLALASGEGPPATPNAGGC